ncbi:MAG: nitroreductase family protein [Candidatus Aenigmatarchaeota archaeon]
METYDLILKRRTIRKYQQKPIDKAILLDCINAARLAPSAMNLQPLDYVLVTKPDSLKKIFTCTNWAGYNRDAGPKPGEEPVAYIVIISDKNVNSEPGRDVGLASENIVLTALEHGVASCMLGAINRDAIAGILKIPGNYKVEIVVSMGYPAQESIEDELKNEKHYWLDDDGKLHVPKRKMEDVMHDEVF